VISVDFNEPALGCPLLLNDFRSLIYSVIKPAIFFKAVISLALFYNKKMKIRQTKLFKIGILCFLERFLKGVGYPVLKLK
jgi:hypothetical protein